MIAAIRDAVAASPVVIADGHHRYSTSLAYKAERDEPGGPPDFVMAFIVELAAEQLHVLPIHRVLSEVDAQLDVLAALEPWFEPFDAGPLDGAPTITSRMADAGALALVRPDGFWLLRPRPEAFDGVDDLDSSRLEAAAPGVREPRDHLSARSRERRQSGARRAGHRRRAVAAGDRRSDRRDRPRGQADAPEDHVLRTEAQDGHRVPDARLSG